MSDQEEQQEETRVATKRPIENDDDEAEETEKVDSNETENANPFRSDKPKKKKKKDDSTAGADAIVAATEIGADGQPIVVLSKRQKKRMKQAQVHEKRKDDDNERTIAYLTKWQENREEWKFEKLRQITIQKNILNPIAIPEEHFALALEYLSTTKGVARTHIIEGAEKTIEKFEADINEENRDEILNSPEYKRARDVLQTMN